MSNMPLTQTTLPLSNHAALAERDSFEEVGRCLLAIHADDVERSLGLDAHAVGVLVEASLPRIAPYRPALVVQFGEPAHRLLDALFPLARAAQELGADLDLEARALTKLAGTYEEVRRMIGFLRWYEGDVETIAPSLGSARTTQERDERDADGATEVRAAFVI